TTGRFGTTGTWPSGWKCRYVTPTSLGTTIALSRPSTTPSRRRTTAFSTPTRLWTMATSEAASTPTDAERHYPTVPTADLCDLVVNGRPVGQLVEADAVLSCGQHRRCSRMRSGSSRLGASSTS